MDMHTVIVYDTNPITIEFLQGFFRKSRKYKAEFIKDIKPYLQMRFKENHIFLIGAPECLSKIKADVMACPVVVMISGDQKKGLRAVIKHNVSLYLSPPFGKVELEYKLDAAFAKKSSIQSLYNEKKDLEAIVELTALVSSTLDPKEILYHIVKKLSELIDVTRCSILSTRLSDKKEMHVMSTFEDKDIHDITLDIGKYPEIMQAMKSKKTVVVKDALRDPLMKPVHDVIKHIGIRSIVVSPVIFRDEVIGSLFLRTSRTGHVFTEREIKLCNAVANASANALYNAFLYEKVNSEKERLQNLAITDFLTGVFNIRYLYHRLDGEFSRSVRYGTDLCCIMFDIDHFKNINDTYGHRIGDIVLREFAQLIKQYTRKSDIFARYGGEEFILILPQTTLKGAEMEAMRLMEQVRKYNFTGLEGQNINLTMSVGVAGCPNPKVKTQDDLINIADQALLRAKQEGRNIVVVSR